MTPLSQDFTPPPLTRAHASVPAEGQELNTSDRVAAGTEVPFTEKAVDRASALVNLPLYDPYSSPHVRPPPRSAN
jgi:hypothetical protein